MFSSHQVQRTLVTLTFQDGSKSVVSVKLPLSGKLAEALNSQEQFLDVISGTGEAYFIAKSKVARAEATEIPQAMLNQQRRTADQAQFNPYAVLGIQSTASKDEIRTAYVTLAKMYHPDRFLTFDIPQEMKDYAASMQARINLAYEQIG
jgi:ubiquinone/menaquinone biosynthesis C-methylase UbiE